MFRRKGEADEIEETKQILLLVEGSDGRRAAYR